MIEFASNGGKAEGYVAGDSGPGVLVIQEWWGLNDHIKSIVDRFAAEGFIALAPDLYHGEKTTEPDGAGKLMMAMNIDEASKDMSGAIDELQKRSGRTKVGAIGFCMGGGFALSWACSDDRLRAVAPFYGMNPRPLEAVSRSCPVVGSYPGRDFTAGSGRKLDGVLDGFGVTHDIKVYPGARHSFFNENGRNYDAAAADDAWQRVSAFFDAHIRNSAFQTGDKA